MALDLDSYLERIGYEGPVEPTLEVLDALQLAHSTTIPFENLDILLGRPIRLDLTSLQGKLVRDRRGGDCFEHNTLFAAALEGVGVGVAPPGAGGGVGARGSASEPGAGRLVRTWRCWWRRTVRGGSPTSGSAGARSSARCRSNPVPRSISSAGGSGWSTTTTLAWCRPAGHAGGSICTRSRSNRSTRSTTRWRTTSPPPTRARRSPERSPRSSARRSARLSCAAARR